MENSQDGTAVQTSLDSNSALENFLLRNLGRKRILFLRHGGNAEGVREQLKQHGLRRGFAYLYASAEGSDLRKTLPPLLQVDIPQLVVLDDLRKTSENFLGETIHGQCRWILDLAGKEAKPLLHRDSSLVLLADEDFPLSEFSRQSLTWATEAALLDLRDFQQRLAARLAVYRKKILGIESLDDAGLLPQKHRLRNFSMEVRDDLQSSPYLRGIAQEELMSLTSPRVMAVNFFYPLLRRHMLERFFQALGTPFVLSDNLDALELDAQYAGQPVVKIPLRDGSMAWIFCRYAEEEFLSGAIQNEKVWEELRDGLHPQDRVILLYPRGNGVLQKAARQAETSMGKDSPVLLAMSWEEIIVRLLNLKRDNRLAYYYKEWFSIKYLRY
jgi:hypothetical protein